MSDMENLKQRAIELIKKHPNGISKHLLEKELHIGIVTVNRLVEWLENNNVIAFKQIIISEDTYYKINKNNLN
jgi:hypothetical protein